MSNNLKKSYSSFKGIVSDKDTLIYCGYVSSSDVAVATHILIGWFLFSIWQGVRNISTSNAHMFTFIVIIVFNSIGNNNLTMLGHIIGLYQK